MVISRCCAARAISSKRRSSGAGQSCCGRPGSFRLGHIEGFENESRPLREHQALFVRIGHAVCIAHLLEGYRSGGWYSDHAPDELSSQRVAQIAGHLHRHRSAGGEGTRAGSVSGVGRHDVEFFDGRNDQQNIGAGSSANVYGPRLTNSRVNSSRNRLDGFGTDAVEFRVESLPDASSRQSFMKPIEGGSRMIRRYCVNAGVGRAVDATRAARGNARQAIVGDFLGRAIGGAAAQGQAKNESRCKPPHAA